jgi:hypothetical protein
MHTSARKEANLGKFSLEIKNFTMGIINRDQDFHCSWLILRQEGAQSPAKGNGSLEDYDNYR